TSRRSSCEPPHLHEGSTLVLCQPRRIATLELRILRLLHAAVALDRIAHGSERTPTHHEDLPARHHLGEGIRTRPLLRVLHRDVWLGVTPHHLDRHPHPPTAQPRHVRSIHVHAPPR